LKTVGYLVSLGVCWLIFFLHNIRLQWTHARK